MNKKNIEKHWNKNIAIYFLSKYQVEILRDKDGRFQFIPVSMKFLKKGAV